MTIQEFSEQADRLTCKRCNASSPTTFHESANNSTGVVCSKCGLRHCVEGVMWLKVTGKKRRKQYRLEDGLYEVWERNGNVCWVCGLPISFLVAIGIGIDRHHPWEYAKTGHDGPVIPVCKPCHTFVTLRQQEAKRWQQRLQEFHAESVPPGGSEVSESGLSPDSVQTEEQDPVGVMEGFPDDHAD